MAKIKNQVSRGTVLITGGAKRLGAELAIYLSTLGFDIALHYNRSQNEAKILAKKIQTQKVRCEIFSANLSQETQVQGLIPKVFKRFPDLRVLINSASIFEKSRLRDNDLKNLDLNLTVNFKAPYVMMSQFAKLVTHGQIINMLDTNVVKNKISHVNYLLSKKSLADLTQMAAVELAPQIRVNAIAPGLILPPENKTYDYLDRLATSIPLKRRGKPVDIAKAVQFLLENDYITGQTIFVDGGEHLI